MSDRGSGTKGLRSLYAVKGSGFRVLLVLFSWVVSVSTFWDCGFGIVGLRFGDEGFGNEAHGFVDWLPKSRVFLREAAQPCRIQCQARGSKARVDKALVKSQPLNPDP